MHEAAISHRHSRTRAATVALWVLQALLAAAFLMAGGSKVAGAQPMVELFDAVGVGQWFRYFTGGMEVLGAVLLLVPSLAGLGALHLAAIMAGATVAHLTVLDSSPAPPLVLLVALSVVVAARRSEIAARLPGARAR